MERRAAEGFRLLGLACGAGDEEHDLTWLGFVWLWDPPRPEVADAIARARAAGIRVLMVTGDHPATAATVARAIGIDAEHVRAGPELERMDPTAFGTAVAEANVFARVRPEQKLAIIEALTARGEIVAMTGDGVNDGPALKRAAVGVAMGLRGSDVSREVADLVLLDDNFATIVAAVEEGRGVYENVQTFVRFLFATNLAEVLAVTLGAAAAVLLDLREGAGGLLLPFTAAQLLWINLVTDGMPALALGLDRASSTMAQPPRPPASPLLDPASLWFVGLAGFGIALVTVALLVLPIPWIAGAGEARTAAFTLLAAAQLGVPYAARRVGIGAHSNRALHLAVGGSLVLQAALVASPWLRAPFDVVALGPHAWVTIGVAWLASLVLVHGARRLAWRSSGHLDGGSAGPRDVAGVRQQRSAT